MRWIKMRFISFLQIIWYSITEKSKHLGECLSKLTLLRKLKYYKNKYSLTENDIIAGFEGIDSIEESPEGIDSLCGNDYWELKVLDLKSEIAQYKANRGAD